MISKEQLDNFLRVNGLEANSPNDEIRSALVSAHWHKNDVEIALTILRGKEQSDSVEIIATQQLFGRQLLQSDQKIPTAALSSLLGITVHGSAGDNAMREVYYNDGSVRDNSTWMQMLVYLLAFVIAVSGILGSMYIMKIGPFYIGNGASTDYSSIIKR